MLTGRELRFALLSAACTLMIQVVPGYEAELAKSRTRNPTNTKGCLYNLWEFFRICPHLRHKGTTREPVSEEGYAWKNCSWTSGNYSDIVA